MKKVNPITARVKAKFARLTKPTKEFTIGNINQSTEPAIAPSGHIGMVPQKAIPSMAKQTKAKAAESKATASKSKSESKASDAKVKPISDSKSKEPVEIPKFTGKTNKDLSEYMQKVAKTLGINPKEAGVKDRAKLDGIYEKELTSLKKIRGSKSSPQRSRTTSKGSGSGYSSRSTTKPKTKAKATVKTKKEKAEGKDEEKASMAKNYKKGYYGVGKDKKEKASMAKNYKDGYYGAGKSKKKKKK